MKPYLAAVTAAALAALSPERITSVAVEAATDHSRTGAAKSSGAAALGTPGSSS